MNSFTKEEAQEMQNKPYRELVGCIIYLANATRPDLCFAANILSRYCVNPGIVHWQLAKRVLRYIKDTQKYSICYEKSAVLMNAYVDADWGGDLDDRKSCTGYVVMLANGPISWETKKQKSVALSTMEAEYMGLTEISKEMIYLKRLLGHMKLSNCVDVTPTVYCDNQSAIQLSKNCVYHGRSKHIDLRFHFIRDAINNNDVKIIFVRTEEMKADILTKSLARHKHEHCVTLMNLNKRTNR